MIEKEKKIEELDPEAREKVLREKAVDNALLKAQGVKVFESSASLQKVLDRKRKQKVKSAKKWEERVQRQENAKQEELQKKQEKKEARMEKKKVRAEKNDLKKGKSSKPKSSA
eukprot:TRINITY_DN3826_c0_g1_i3.p1 TRINITY_DN3826_c0_g1~~TRINITY_DN3826_c0_g1_i3.p1  ORF type:complete len:113 (+),score=58.10 TRINITY_DN3826_c0_g1_i3:92-430(+)